MRFGHFLPVAIVFTAIVAAPLYLRAAVTPQEIEKTIERAKEYLYKEQKNGNWELVQSAPKPAADDVAKLDGKQWGGITSLATYALLAAGDRPQTEKRLADSIEFLQKHMDDVTGVYAVSSRAQIWQYLPPTPVVRACVKRDATFLQESLIRVQPAKGYYTYVRPGAAKAWDWFDRSNSQYGVLGMWACEQAGIEVSQSYWQMVEDAWVKGQKRDGGWSYQDTGGDAASKPSMTAAGVATLFLTQDYLRAGDGTTCKGNISNDSIDKGLKWMTENFPKDPGHIMWRYYLLYGIERIGLASGYKYFGTTDWYQNGAEFLVKSQGEDGSYTGDGIPVANAAWAILFLVRGRAPVVMNKLQYDLPPVDGKPVVTRWNQRPRDAANLTSWVRKQTERWVNWQIVNLKVPVEELHDSPILYITGNQKLALAKADIDKLKQFVEQGGLILGNADCGSKDFAESFRKLGAAMFPAYEFRELPADHSIYTDQQYNRSKWKSPPSVMGLSNGARELMILLPAADPAKAWQMQDQRSKAEAYQLGINIYLYSIEKQTIHTRGVTYIVSRDEKIAAGAPLKLARLEYGGNWNPEPGGWRRIANLLHNNQKIELTVEPIKLGDGKLDASFKVAHLTGTGPIKLTPQQQEELKKYVDGGGMLIIDAAGGALEFSTSAETLLQAIAPGAKATAIAATHPAVAQLKDPAVRKSAMKVVGKSAVPLPRAIESNGKIGVVFSPLDLSVGIVGQTIDGIAGYTPETAAELVKSLIVYASNK